jgi:O-antigen ligase
MVFILPASIAGVKSFGSLAILLFLIRMGVQAAEASRMARGQRFEAVRKAWGLSVTAPAVEVMAGAFILICLCAVFISQYPGLSFIALAGKIFFAASLLVVTHEILVTPARILWFIRILLLSAGIICLDGIWQWVTGHDLLRHISFDMGRINASMRHPNDLGAYLLFVILPVAVIFFSFLADLLKQRTDAVLRKTVFWGLSTVLIFLIMGLTYSRGAWFGLACAAGILVALQPKLWKHVCAATVLFLIVFLPIMAFQRGDIFDPGYLADGKLTEEGFQAYFNSSGRLKYWQDAWVIFVQSPITGVGLNTYTQVIKQYPHAMHNYAHNSFLQMAVEIGVFGLLAFLGFIVALFMAVVRRVRAMVCLKARAVLLAFLAGWCGVFVHSFFDTTFYSAQLWPLIWVMAGFLLIAPVVLKNTEMRI